jgi:hypothetical protein
MGDIFLWSTIILAIWGAVGPLVGVRYGQELAKKWQRQQWISENRKQECRELLNLMAANYFAKNVARGRQARPEDHALDRDVTFKLANAFRSCIFVAKEIEALKVRERWSQFAARTEVASEERLKTFNELFAEIRGLVI